MMEEEETFDAVIIGAGPASLAMLSALQEPYEMDTLTDLEQQCAAKCVLRRTKKRVVVVDPAPLWLGAWRHNFVALGI